MLEKIINKNKEKQKIIKHNSNPFKNDLISNLKKIFVHFNSHFKSLMQNIYPYLHNISYCLKPEVISLYSQEITKYFEDNLELLNKTSENNFENSREKIREKRPNEFLVSLHNHTSASDGIDIIDILESIKQIDVIAITDHNTTKGYDDLFKQRNLFHRIEKINDVSLIYKNKKGHEIYLIRGIELKVKLESLVYEQDELKNKLKNRLKNKELIGELNLIGVNSESLPYLKAESGIYPKMDIKEALKISNENNYLVLLNHPSVIRLGVLSNNIYFINQIYDKIDAIEWNANMLFGLLYVNVLAQYLADKYGIPLISTNDAHNSSQYEHSGFYIQKEDFAVNSDFPNRNLKIILKKGLFENKKQYHSFISSLKVLFGLNY